MALNQKKRKEKNKIKCNVRTCLPLFNGRKNLPRNKISLRTIEIALPEKQKKSPDLRPVRRFLL
jgi:hypothetical protein